MTTIVDRREIAVMVPPRDATRRGGLLLVALAAHAALLLALPAGRSPAPPPLASPLRVVLLPAAPAAASQLATSSRSAARPPATRVQQTTPDATAPGAPPAGTAAAPAIAAAAGAAAAEPLSPAIFDAAYLNNPAPRYPPLSRRSGEEGKVILRVSVNRQGSADSVEVGTSSGSPRLDDAAVSTVRHWKFIPARRGDTPVQSWVLVPITFRMEQ